MFVCCVWSCQVSAELRDVQLVARTNEMTSLDDRIVKEGVPKGIVHLDVAAPELVWVDLAAGQMYRLKLSRSDWYSQATAIPISLGKAGEHKRLEADLKTPVGVYHVTSYLADHQLNSKYGDGAFPINYPSAFDLLQGRTGRGIWLHGLPKGLSSRPLLHSDGCVVIDNQRLTLLKPLLRPSNAMVVLAEGLEWLDARPESYDLFLQQLNTWREDWESLDLQRYFGHYGTGLH